MDRPLRYPQLDDGLVRRLIPLAEALNDLVETGRECSRQIKEFNALAGTSIEDPLEFHFSGASTAEVFVRDVLARPHVGEFTALNDAELLELVRSVQNGTAPDEAPFWLHVLELNLPGAPISDLLFHPDSVLSALGVSNLLRDDLEAKDILDLARRFPAAQSAIPLGPPEHDDTDP